MSVSGTEELLERVRARQKLPRPAERRRIRERAGVSLRDMAAAVGVSHASIRTWEAGKWTPRVHRAAYVDLLAELKRLTPSSEMREPDLSRAQDSRDDNVDDKPTAA
jgi:transcriptional regulator with XRE-family HTH domain